MPIQRALQEMLVEYHEEVTAIGEARASGVMLFGDALEGPPGRLHGGHHTHVRTLPLLERVTAHDAARTFPCALDVRLERSLPLNEPVRFEARYSTSDEAWELETRLAETDRLLAKVRSIAAGPLMTPGELGRWRELFEAAQPPTGEFKMFGITVKLAADLVYIECEDPQRTAPESQLALLVDEDGHLGPAFMATQLDAIGAVARGTLMRHPHFTTRVELRYAAAKIPAHTPLLCLGDRTTIEEIHDARSAKVEIKGTLWGTARIAVALVDREFKQVYAAGHITVHPVDGSKFEALKKMRELRDDT